MELFQQFIMAMIFGVGVFFIVKPEIGANILLNKLKRNALYAKSVKNQMEKNTEKMLKMAKIGSIIVGIGLIGITICIFYFF